MLDLTVNYKLGTIMRDIKFRAWDSDKSLMVQWDELIEEKGDPRDVGSYNLLSVILAGNSCGHNLMQFTGLRDCNGVCIYEGDIVDDNFVGVGEVIYNEKHAAFKIIYNDRITAKWFIDMLKRESRIIEVIGNIHQNPELL